MIRFVLYKRLLLLSASLCFALLVTAQDKPTAAPAIKSFAIQQDVTGAASNSVNLFTGDLALPINLLSLPGHNGLDASVSIAYNSNIQNVVNTWNLESHTGILGLGWDMDVPRIVADNKQTGTREDDEYYLIQGGSSNRLIRTVSGSDAAGSYYVYQTKNYQFWKIQYYYDISELYGSTGYGSGPNKWLITTEDGTTYVYGDKNSGRNTIQWVVRWENWIGNSSQTLGQSQLANVWNLSEVVNMWNEKILFEYENVEQYVGTTAGQKHTEASYIKQITDVNGRKVQFFYNTKDPQFYTEPHTEQPEPDAYQEVYEKKYLDHIDVLLESGYKFLSVQFGYNSVNAGTSKAKMLLTSIVQKNRGGDALPGLTFEYYAGGATNGFLKTVTYPTGGTVTYTYTGSTLSHSNRQFTAQAPAGYAEPKVWSGDDYVVVTWRQLGTGTTHDTNPRDVKLYVYQWVGEWKEQFLQSISNVGLDGDSYHWDYKSFQVVVQKEFFAVLAPTTTNYYQLFIRFKDVANRGNWSAYTTSIDYGTGVPTLMSGTNFVAVGSFQDDGTHPSHLYTFQGDSWKDDVLNQTIGDHYYTSVNNYFISQNRAGFDGQPETNFNYLTEDKKWVTKKWSSYLLYSSTDLSYWYSGNSLAVAMAGNNPEYAYRWDLTYTNFYKDSKDKNNADLFGLLQDNAPVFIQNNSMVGIYGKLARFDGKAWSVDNITSSHTSPFGLYFSYGDDYVVRPTASIIGSPDFKGGRKVFDPNLLQWQPDYIMSGADAGQDFANAGIDYYYYGNGYYYRQPNGSWVKKATFSWGQSMFCKGSYSRFDVWYGMNPAPVYEIRIFKNGEVSGALTLSGRNFLDNNLKFKSSGVGVQTLITYPNTFSEPGFATSLQLNRVVNDNIAGYAVDYPVTLITVNNGNTSQYTTFAYNLSTATADPSGNTAMYNEVTTIQGSSNASSKPYGYTKTFFYNGLTSTELGVSYTPMSLLWNGSPYETRVYDNNDVMQTSTKTSFNTYSKTFTNSDGIKVQVGYYTRPNQTNSIADGIETVATQYYDANTGMIVQNNVQDNDSRGNQVITRYKYFWEQYDLNRAKNILSPVIQTKQSILSSTGETFTDVSAVTWKTWNSVFAPHKTYKWRRSGTTDFDFSAWSNTGEPTADWKKVSQIEAMDNTGNVLEVSNQ